MQPTPEYQDPNVSNIWDKVAVNYDYDLYWNGLENHANLKVLLTHIGNPQEKKIIEVGCGSGFLSAALAKMGAQSTLLDISPEAIKVAVKAFTDLNLPEPEYYLEDALKSHIPSNRFDIAWNGGVIEHFFDNGKELFIKEMVRIVKPGGQVIILVPNSNCWPFQLIQQWMKMRKTWSFGFEDDMSPGRLKKMCLRLGIRHIQVYAFNTVTGWQWIPKFGPILKRLGWETMERYCKRSWMGFVSVLVIQKEGSSQS
jgi:ubiquinone/menaquinone biosynthesis C-methylase UbiE